MDNGFIKNELLRIKKQPLRLLLHLSVIAALGLNIWFLRIHEPYRDEAQVWLIARDFGPLSIFKVLALEGHPFLWYYLVMPFAKLGFPYVTIRILSTVLMAAAILIIAYKSPFFIPVRMGIILSAMCLYRYPSFGRNYSLYVLLITLICCFYSKRHDRPMRYLLAVSALIQTHALAVGFSFGLCAGYFAEELIRIRKSGFSFRSLSRRLSPLLAPFLSGMFLFVEFSNVKNSDASHISMRSLLRKFLPTAKSCLSTLYQETAPLLMVLLLLHVIFLIILYRKGLERLLILLPGWAGSVCVFSLSVSTSDYRAMTLAYMLLWYLWCLKEEMGQFSGRNQTMSVRNFRTDLLFRVLNTALIAVFIFGIDRTIFVTTNTTPIRDDIRYYYSDAQGAAAVIDSLPPDAVVLESVEDFTNAIIPWLREKTVINPFADEPASYANRDIRNRHSMSLDEFMEYCRSRFPDKQEVYLIYCNHCAITGLSYEAYEVIYQPRRKILTSEKFKILRIPLD